MATPLSIRFDPGVLSRLRRRASNTPGASASALAQRLVDEGLRMAEHPGVVFRDGPSGRRAALAVGPDVWEVITAVREIDERGTAAVPATADLLNLSESKIQIALDYYAAHRAEIDAELAQAEEASHAAERAWRSQQQLLA